MNSLDIAVVRLSDVLWVWPTLREECRSRQPGCGVPAVWRTCQCSRHKITRKSVA